MTDLVTTPAPKSTLLAVNGLTFSYAQRHVFSVWSHDFAGGLTWVRGPNGCGKSTLLKLLGGAITPQSGQVSVKSIRLADHPLDYRREVFWCGPGGLAFEHLSMNEYFAFMRSLYRRVDDAALGHHVAGFALEPFVRVPLANLSTGTQRKVWLAMALSAGCLVTLIDEPINALDAASAAHLLSALLLCSQDRSRACIVVSHEDIGPAGTAAIQLELPLRAMTS